ncbi:MAG TPA: CHRD domain-containing protein [Gemmatimonadaceae bacterium]|nr:CHRD domain-containing protein [Gemmatimonadaceae bacterium]
MIHSKLFAMSVMAFAFVAACDTDDDNGTGPTAQTFTASLTGAKERPTPRTTPANGSATFTLSADGNTLTWNVTMTGANNVFASHIHVGGLECDCPVAFGIFSGTAVSNPAISGSVTRATYSSPLGISFDALISLMRSGDTYVNVHTNDGVAPTNTGPGDFPGGELRGQISLVP